MPAKASHIRGSRGIHCPMARMTTCRVRAARPTRSIMMVSGGSSLTATPMKKNDPPHSTERMSSMAHSLAPMVFCNAISSHFRCATDHARGTFRRPPDS